MRITILESTALAKLLRDALEGSRQLALQLLNEVRGRGMVGPRDLSYALLDETGSVAWVGPATLHGCPARPLGAWLCRRPTLCGGPLEASDGEAGPQQPSWSKPYKQGISP